MDNLSSTSDIAFERDLLGMLLLNPNSSLPKIAEFLAPRDFQFPQHQTFFRSFLRIFFQGKPLNSNSVIDDLKLNNSISDSLLDSLLSLKDNVFTDAYALEYAKKIKDKSLRRQLKSFSNSLSSDADNPNLNFSEIISDAESILRSFSSSAAPSLIIEQDFFFDNLFVSEIDRCKQYANRKTGFANIDSHQIFSPGLYVLGATPACGKTTFAWQLLNQLSARGERCIFCSYEMSSIELYTKTLAREMFIANPDNAFSAADIRKGSSSDLLDNVKIRLFSHVIKSNVAVLQLRDENIDDLLRILKPHCFDKVKPPVVCIDYLQIIPPSDSKRLISDKAKIDDVVRKLKTFQRESGTTFIVVSSFNRMNYFQQVSFESFKDSGNIEYTADVVWALQLNAANQTSGLNVSQIRSLFEDAKLHQPRHIQLRCLKNRQGNNYDSFFFYFSKHDFFLPCNISDFDPAPTHNSNAAVDDNDTLD